MAADIECGARSINPTNMSALDPTNGHRSATEPLAAAVPVVQASKRCPVTAAKEWVHSPSGSRHPDWTMVAIWTFVAFSFAAFFLCGFILWAKCRGEWPF
jgi:hypothetical protein